VYLGGLDRSGTDGQCAYFYQDEIMQVIFHVATLMPTNPEDPHCSNKKLHIGNDFVTVIYNDSSQPYPFGTIKGHFNFVEVVVDPLPGNMNRVCLAAKKGVPYFFLWSSLVLLHALPIVMCYGLLRFTEVCTHYIEYALSIWWVIQPSLKLLKYQIQSGSQPILQV